MPLLKRSNLNAPSISDKILVRSEGIFGEIATVVRRASEEAIRNKSEQITEDIIEKLDYHSPTERRNIFAREIV